MRGSSYWRFPANREPLSARTQWYGSESCRTGPFRLTASNSESTCQPRCDDLCRGSRVSEVAWVQRDEVSLVSLNRSRRDEASLEGLCRSRRDEAEAEPNGKTGTSLTSPHGTIMPVSPGWAGCWAAWSRQSHLVGLGPDPLSQSHLVGLGPQSRRAAPRINDGPAWPYGSVSTIGAAFISLEGVPHPKGDERSEWRGDRGERSEQRARPELAKGLRGFSGILP